MPNCCATLILPSACAAAATPSASKAEMSFFFMGASSEREVALDGGAIELAAQVVRRAGRQVKDGPVVPEHHVVRPPWVAVGELGAGAVREQLLQQVAAFVIGQAQDARGEVL